MLRFRRNEASRWRRYRRGIGRGVSSPDQRHSFRALGPSPATIAGLAGGAVLPALAAITAYGATPSGALLFLAFALLAALWGIWASCQVTSAKLVADEFGVSRFVLGVRLQALAWSAVQEIYTSPDRGAEGPCAIVVAFHARGEPWARAQVRRPLRFVGHPQEQARLLSVLNTLAARHDIRCSVSG